VFGGRKAFAKNDLGWSRDLDGNRGTINEGSEHLLFLSPGGGRISGSPFPGVCATLGPRAVIHNAEALVG
jgi:hypothetical protein